MRLSTIVLALFLAICLAIPNGVEGQPIQFRAPISFMLDKLPETIAVGDLNRDGHADAVVTHYVEGTLNVLLGNGQSSLIPAGEFPTREGGIRAYIRDLDNDTKLDLIISHDESDQVSLLRGNGDGTFAAAQEIEPGHDPVGVAIADLDGDERLDLIVALSGENNGELAVMRNLGDMQFERVQLLFIEGDCIEVVVHDFDSDGFLDAALSNPILGGLTRLRGISGGIFEPDGELLFGEGPTLLALADVDSDSDADIIAGLTDISAVGVLRSRGDGTFEPLVTYLSGGDALSGMVVVDVNGDASLDVVTSNLRSRNASILLGRGDGTFGAAAAVTSGANPVEVGVADFNSDGLVDIVSANEGVNSAAPSLNLLLGDGTGRFLAPEQLLAALNPVGAAVGDFNGDSVADAVVGSQHPGLVIHPGAHGELSASSMLVPLDREPEHLLALDVDDDGWTDVAVLSGVDVSVLFANGRGELSAPIHLPLSVRCGAFTAADIDGDGDPDFIAAAARAPAAFYIVRNDDGRLFAEATMVETSVLPSSIAAADVNGDGRGDLITNDRSHNRVFLFQGPALPPSPGLLMQGIVSALAVGDLDANGAADVIAVSPAGRSLSSFLNDGTGVLASAPPQSLGFASAVALRDLDGDGFGEAIVADQLSGETMVFQNDQSGGWRALEPMVSGERLAALAAGDFNDDGRYDLIASGANVYRLINETAAPSVVRGDGNGDGRVTAADFVAVASELFDGDSNQVESVSLGMFVARAGVDTDGDGVVTRADLRALLLRVL